MFPLYILEYNVHCTMYNVHCTVYTAVDTHTHMRAGEFSDVVMGSPLGVSERANRCTGQEKS